MKWKLLVRVQGLRFRVLVVLMISAGLENSVIVCSEVLCRTCCYGK